MRKSIALYLLGLFLVAQCASNQSLLYEIKPYDPVASSNHTFITGSARFTILTESLIRYEYDPTKKFEDRATLAFVNRKLPPVDFTQTIYGNTLSIQTAKLNLTYTMGSQFSAQTLQIRGVGGDPLDWNGTWSYGQLDTGNLFGTIRSLDDYQPTTLNCTQISNVTVHNESLHCAFGVISTQGWTVQNDSLNYVINQTEWWVGMNNDQIDDYFFGYGQNYKQALSDFTLVAGSVPMLPKYSLGVWWTRWFPWDTHGLKYVIENFQKLSLPLDVLVLDMNWHKKNSWGGYSWDQNLLPYPQYTLDWLRSKNLHLAMNVHDDSGVCNYDTQFVPFCQSLGLNPNTTTCVPFEICANQSYALNLEDIVLRPLELQGVDYWWIDWQQGGIEGGCTGYALNPTIWLNKLRSTDNKRRNQGKDDRLVNRSLILARWGGLGNHRYEVGFSGDVPTLNWANLALQPYFSATSANVGYGYWSNDITGPGNDMELYLRWVQFGALSGIMRFHERGMSSGGCAEKVFPLPQGGSPRDPCAQWTAFDTPFQIQGYIREILRYREQLLPYIYTQSQQYAQSGVAFMRPLYYDFPTEALSYQVLNIEGTLAQYMFGDDIFVAPIVTPIDKYSSLVEDKAVWVPPGLWIDETNGQILNGPSWYNRTWDLSEVPTFVRGGAILARRPESFVRQNILGSAQTNNEYVELDIYPGLNTSSSSVYEDDGQTLGYLSGDYSLLNASYSINSSAMNISVQAESNLAKPYLPTQRILTIKLKYQLPISSASLNYYLNGKLTTLQLNYSQIETEKPAYWYDGVDTSVVIQLPRLNSSQFPISLRLSGQFTQFWTLSGVKGSIQHASMAAYNLDETKSTPGCNSLGNTSLIQAAGYSLVLSQSANSLPQFTTLLNQFPQLYMMAYQTISEAKIEYPAMAKRFKYSTSLLESSSFFNQSLLATPNSQETSFS